MIGLTVKQSGLLRFIQAECANGRTPSYEQMRVALGVASKAQIFQRMEALEARGAVVRRGYERGWHPVVTTGDHKRVFIPVPQETTK